VTAAGEIFKYDFVAERGRRAIPVKRAREIALAPAAYQRKSHVEGSDKKL